MRRAWAIVVALCCAGCSDELPPLGEALVVVDTDLPVPRLASALRLDVYSSDGKIWHESRDIPRPDPRDWPASFSVYSPTEGEGRSALVRIRVYPNGKVRDYRGERFGELPIAGADPAAEHGAAPPDDEARRLERDGIDVTPAEEPQPLLTIDRLMLVQLEPEVRGSLRIVLSSACLGTMADLEGRRSCVDRRGELLPLQPVALDDDMSLPAESQQGAFGTERACTAEPRDNGASPLFDSEVCLPGAAFIFGNSDNFGAGDATGTPERVAQLPPFMIDRYEVTVARWRKALSDGFASPDATPLRNEGPIDTTAVLGSAELCSYSDTSQSREGYPLTCVSWTSARAFCQFHGGDLPSEAQWEYAAQAAGRDLETRYPWGNDAPNCGRAVYGRTDEAVDALFGGDQCLSDGEGPQPVDLLAHEQGDATGSGIYNLGGSVAEMLRDSYLPLSSNCWVGAPLDSPLCEDARLDVRAMRGGSWASSSISVYAGLRQGRRTTLMGTPFVSSWQGFRCVRSVDD
jgi:formylglycine-generating enzyme required for sulfatase activity